MSTPFLRRLAQYQQPPPPTTTTPPTITQQQQQHEQTHSNRLPGRTQSIKRPLPPLPPPPTPHTQHPPLTPISTNLTEHHTPRTKPLPQPPPSSSRPFPPQPIQSRTNELPTTNSFDPYQQPHLHYQHPPPNHPVFTEYHQPSFPSDSEEQPSKDFNHESSDSGCPTLVVNAEIQEEEISSTQETQNPNLPEISVPRMVFNDIEDEEEEQKIPSMVVTEDENVPGIVLSLESPSAQSASKKKKPFIGDDDQAQVERRRGPRSGGVSGPRTITPHRRQDRVSSQSRLQQRSIPQITRADPSQNSAEPPLIPSDPNKLICNGCRQQIAGRIVHAINAKWHPDCFVCRHCNLVLEHVAFYEHEGKAYCGVDYDELFSLKCYHCNTSINEDSYVTLDDPSLKDGPRHYHKLHLFCSECGDPFIDPKSLEERSRISRSAVPSIQHPHPQEQQHEVTVSDPKPFVLHKGFPYCEKCDIRLHRPKCFACKAPILADFVNALNKLFHSNCFVCFECTNPFSNNQFFLVPLSDLDPSLDHKSKRGSQQVPICLNCYS